MKKILILALSVCFIMPTVFAQSKAEKKQIKEEQVASAIENKNIKIDISSMIPQEMDIWNVSGQGYYLELKSDSVFSFMPYAGTAYRSFPGTETGMRFEVPTTDYKVEYKGRGINEISFQAKTYEDIYTFFVSISTDGGVEIFVRPENKQTVTYIGKVNTNVKKNKRR